MQEVIVIVLVVGAIVYIGYRAYNSYSKKNVEREIVDVNELGSTSTPLSVTKKYYLIAFKLKSKLFT